MPRAPHRAIVVVQARIFENATIEETTELVRDELVHAEVEGRCSVVNLRRTPRRPRPVRLPLLRHRRRSV
jgi:hypothetical protein